MANDKQIAVFKKVDDAQESLSMENHKAAAADLLKDFSQVDPSMLQGLTQEYLQMKESTTYNMIFTGMTTFKGDKGGEVPAVSLINETGMSFINGNTVLVNSLRKVQQLPCFVKIVTGKRQKSASGGAYLDMEVYVLPKVANADKE